MARRNSPSEQRRIGGADDSFAFWFSKCEARDCRKNSAILPLSAFEAGSFRLIQVKIFGTAL